MVETSAAAASFVDTFHLVHQDDTEMDSAEN
jgi:hypothetical protein